MSEQVNLIKKARQLDISDLLVGYSKVIIYAGQDDEGNDIVYTAGDDSGSVMTFKNEFGSQEMAENVLRRISGFQYQPYTAENAMLDPSAELGDGIVINDISSGLYVRRTNFGKLMASNISAPKDEEIEHDFQFESSADRQYSRFVAATKAALKITSQNITAEVEARTTADSELYSAIDIQATSIAAKVSKTGGDSSSFGWTLEDDHWSVYSNGMEVFKITDSGASVKGSIEADSGYIGGENGFAITANKIYKNISDFGGTQSNGVYIGTNGLQLGQNFKVDSLGNVTANNMNITGTLTVAGSQISAQSLYLGAYQAAANYNSWNGASGLVNANSATWTSGSVGGANFTAMSNNAYTPEWVTCNHFSCTNTVNTRGVYAVDVETSTLKVGSRSAQWKTAIIPTDMWVGSGSAGVFVTGVQVLKSGSYVTGVYPTVGNVYVPTINYNLAYISYLGA